VRRPAGGGALSSRLIGRTCGTGRSDRSSSRYRHAVSSRPGATAARLSARQRQTVQRPWASPLAASWLVRDAGHIPSVTSRILPAPDTRYIHGQRRGGEARSRPQETRSSVMQTVPVSGTRDNCGQVPRPVRLLMRPDTFGGSRKRCQRCDIPLGPQPCPNPQCREPHGQSAGELCAWCRHHQEESRDVRNGARLPDSQCAVLSRASARLGGVAGPMDRVPRADPVWEPWDGSCV